MKYRNDDGIMRLSLASGTLAWNQTAHGSDAWVDATIVPDEIKGLHSKGEHCI